MVMNAENNTGSSTGMTTTIDANHPLYLQGCDTTGSSLISFQLTGPENYALRSRSMRIGLLGKSKMGLVDGRHTKDKFPSSLHDLWEKVSAMVLSWIMSSVSKDLLSCVAYASSACMHKILMEEEGGARKSPRRSSRILSDVGTSNQKVYRRSRMRGQVSSPTDEVNDCPNFSLGISQVSGEQNKDVYKKLSDSVRHELKLTHKYYRLGGLPLALQIWIFECCSKVDEDIAIRVADSIPRILNWKTIAESPWQKYIEKCLFMPTKNKFENIMASKDEVSKFRLPEPRDYNAEILKLEPKGSSHGLDMLTNEVIELRKELVKVNENNKALEEKIDLGFNQIKEFVVNSNKQLLEDISLLFAKSGGSSSVVIREVKEPSKKQAGETFSGGLDFNGGHDAHVMRSNQNEESQVLKTSVRFADVENFERVSSKIVQEVADVNTVGAQPYDATEDCQKPLHTLDDFIFLDEDLSQINRTEESYLKKRAHVDQNKKKVTPKKRGRKKNSGKGKKPYTYALTVISPAFELGICNVAERHWFFKLAHSGQEWCDETKITTSFFQLCDAHENKKNYKVKDSDDIARSLEVYDSFPARDGVNFEVKNIVEMLSIVLPYYLSVVKFYDKRSELKATPKYSGIDEFEKIEFHFITKGVPRQQDDSL
ncbi:hypothetical protein KY290_015826 [Solanum tuberosum]|uniref:Retrotransposon Copia-like N-terminal domain-containing protein n=1 Tax=Solanum tuberosum TaxID=4113 RepID=A0ABQ7VU84_SOLTU|nr:hypothetical protein KY285_013027 [Solanum tuberosum]KAH0771845.1 hypothetical protein KY290_015826 [Solanum tuberosum]